MEKKENNTISLFKMINPIYLYFLLTFIIFSDKNIVENIYNLSLWSVNINVNLKLFLIAFIIMTIIIQYFIIIILKSKDENRHNKYLHFQILIYIIIILTIIYYLLKIIIVINIFILTLSVFSIIISTFILISIFLRINKRINDFVIKISNYYIISLIVICIFFTIYFLWYYKYERTYKLNSYEINKVEVRNFKNATLYNTIFTNCIIDSCNFSNADFRNTKFDGLLIKNTKFDSLHFFNFNIDSLNKEIYFSRIYSDNDFSVSFKNATLENISFKSAYLIAADFSSATFNSTIDFTNSSIIRAKFVGCDLSSRNVKGLTLSMFAQTNIKNLKNIKYPQNVLNEIIDKIKKGDDSLLKYLEINRYEYTDLINKLKPQQK